MTGVAGGAGRRAAELRPRIGGKAAALVAALEVGLPVPPLVSIDVDEVASFVGGGPLGAAVAERVAAACAQLGGGPLAVRSSAQLEDADLSFAGQFETRLDIVGSGALHDAIDAVAASGGARRVVEYAHATSSDAGRIAVFVQRMVRARHAGVAFSRDPVTYQPEVVVEAVEGRSDGLLAGVRTPTRAALDAATFEVLFLEQRDEVPREILRAAARLALECERHFGAPADVEWAHDGDQMWLVQARPLTGFDAVQIHSDTWSSEVWPGLIRPLVFDVGDIAVNAAWGRILTSIAGPMDVDWRRMAARVASRAYFNETLLGSVLTRAGLPENTLEVVGRGERPQIRDGSSVRLAASAGRLSRFLAGNARLLRRVARELPALDARIAAAGRGTGDLTPVELADRFEVLVDILEDSAHLSVLTMMSMQLRALAARAAMTRRTGEGGGSALPPVSKSAPAEALDRLSEAVLALPSVELDAVASGEPERIAEALGSSPQGRRALRAMEELLSRWGHIATVNTDFSAPTWADDPGALWYLAAASRPVAGTKGRRGATAADPGGAPAGRVRGWIVRGRIESLATFVAARDEVNDALARTYDALRHAARAAGALLTPAVLESEDDVYFLRYPELLAALRGDPADALGATCAHRRSQLEADARIAPPHRVWNLRLPPRQRMLAHAQRAPLDAGVLRGIPASAGVASGRARVLDLADPTSGLGPGDVLVVGHADVAWTPVFSVVAGVVTEAGGMLCHAAVVAREIGIPAVVGVDNATRLIADGARIQIDGSEGSVTVIRPAGASTSASTVPADTTQEEVHGSE
ncbi:MAG: PEP/pyruvate-binding domain-containing protein [Candidatus Nanopelagicales bacterium]